MRALVLRVAAQESVYAERQASYVSLRPGSGGPIAAFVDRVFVDIAQPPGLAAAKASGLPGATLVEDTPARTFVRLIGEGAQLPAAVTLVKGALAWRATMPDNRSDGPGNGVIATPTCPDCCLQHAGECLKSP